MKIWTHKYIRATRSAHRVLAELTPEDVRSVAVIKHAALGDMVLARPFFVAVRQNFPNAHITASVIANYVNGVPEDLVDRVHVAAGKFRPRPSFRTRLSSYRELGYHDLIFDITASSDSHWITLVNPARLKIGYRHSLHAYLLYDVAIPRSIFKFEAENFLDQLAVLRLRYDWPLNFGYALTHAPAAEPYLLYFPTASVVDRCWPAGHYARLMARLAEALPEHEHVLLFGVAEWEVAVGEEVVATAGARGNVRAVRDARGEEFQRLVRQASLVIANNTGVRNLAIAMGTPTLGIFPFSLVYTYLPRGGLHDVVHDVMGGQPSVDRVYAAALRMMEAIAH